MNHIIEGKSSPQTALVQALTVDDSTAGQRLDNFLIRHLKGVPKTHIYRIIRSGEVRVNKGRAQADTRLQMGDILRLPPVRVSERATEKSQAMVAQSGNFVPPKNFPVLFEDDCLLAIDKPAGSRYMAVQASVLVSLSSCAWHGPRPAFLNWCTG